MTAAKGRGGCPARLGLLPRPTHMSHIPDTLATGLHVDPHSVTLWVPKLVQACYLALRLLTRSSRASRLNAFRNRTSNLEHAQLQHTIAGVVPDTAQVTGFAE